MQVRNAGPVSLLASLAYNYMQRPKNAVALSRDATWEEAFVKLRNSKSGAHPSFPRRARDGSAVVFH